MIDAVKLYEDVSALEACYRKHGIVLPADLEEFIEKLKEQIVVLYEYAERVLEAHEKLLNCYKRIFNILGISSPENEDALELLALLKAQLRGQVEH